MSRCVCSKARRSCSIWPKKFGAFLPEDGPARTEVMNWVFWQMGSAPYLGGGFGHFFAYAPEKWEYPINRFAMEAKRQLDVLDRELADKTYIAGEDYTIADMAIWPWYGQLVLGRLYDAGEFLDAASYKNVVRWAKAIDARPAVSRGRMVNRSFGEPHTQLHRAARRQRFRDPHPGQAGARRRIRCRMGNKAVRPALLRSI